MWSLKFSDSQPKNSPVYVGLVSVLLPDIGSLRSYTYDPSQHYLLHALDLSLYVESDAIWEDE